MALEMGNISGFAMGIVGSGVIVGIGVYVVVTMKTNLGSATAAVNTTFDNTVSGAGAIPGWFPVLVVAGMGFLALSFFVNKA
jgi:hypothetical protein